MTKQKSKRPFLSVRLLIAFSIILFVMSWASGFGIINQAEAATNSTLNFQARLLTAGGKQPYGCEWIAE